MAFMDRHILSRPHPVYWAGFRSNTVALQQAGWEFSASQHYELDEVGLMMRHQATGMHACTSTVPSMLYEMHDAAPAFNIGWMTDKSVRWQHVGGFDVQPWVDDCKPVDMRPQIVDVRDIEDMHLFAGCMARTQELIVDPDDVGDMMNRILELQDPARQEYYKRQLRANQSMGAEMRAAPRQQFHAQVVSLVA